MKRFFILSLCIIYILLSVVTANASVKYKKIASFKDIGQNRVFFIALTEEIQSTDLKESLWEIVNYYMDKYGQAPQMWIFFFDSKKYTPKEFPIQGEVIDHLIAKYFYATDTRIKELTVLTEKDLSEIKKEGKIDSPLWQGQ